MPVGQFVNEAVEVQVRFLPDGQPRPVAFVWRQQIRYVADVGRQWREEAGGIAWQCYLVRTQEAETFELRFHLVDDRWVLYRAWPGSSAAV